MNTWTEWDSEGKLTGPDNFAGAGVVESFFQTADSMKRLKDGDVTEVGLNAAALSLDLLGVFMDPVGALATAGIGWLIEHLSFLREPLDWLAGNGDKIKSAVGTWNQVSIAIAQIADEQNKAVQNGEKVPSKPWQQDAVDAYTPFKPITKADGSVTPHSVPNVMDGGYQIKLGADVLRETSKQDELEMQGLSDDQKAFRRQQGHLDL